MIDTAYDIKHTVRRTRDNPYAPLPSLPLATATSLAALAPPSPALLGPIAPGSITVIRGARGAGKSWLALAMSRAVADGASLLGWSGRPAAVIHVEAAMAQAAVGARLRALGAAAGNLRLICDCPLDLGEVEDQARLMAELPDGALLVLDGLSLLVPAGRGAAARWQSLCDWLRALRKDGHAVLLVEHAHRPAVDALADTLITLKRERDARRVAFTAEIVSRNALAPADRAFTARLDLADGAARWTREAVADPALRAIAAAAREGGTVRDIAERIGLSTATAWRRLERAKALGLIADDRPGETGETPAPAATSGKPRETSETGETAPRAALAGVSTSVLRRTLARRLEARQRDGAGAARPGPAVLAGIADAELVAECTRRLKPPQAARLMQRFAALQSAA